jgi:asparagine synthase (glutamine-hydrolysing)
VWALAVFDALTGKGVLARDRYGVKPLYYDEQGDRLVFASEISALREAGLRATNIDPAALTHYLRLGFVPHPMTIYASVRKLPPGHLLRFGPGGVSEPRRWYHLPVPVAASRPPSYDEACGEVRRRTAGAVNARIAADVPVGVLLSGGVDSAILVAHLAAAAGPRVKTFTLGFADSRRYDELPLARRIARRYATDHHEFRLTFTDVVDALPTMLDHLGEPFADSSLLPTALLCRHTGEHVTVALAGDGGDELFAGYWRYRGHQYLERYRRLPGWLRRRVVMPLVHAGRLSASGRWGDRIRRARRLLRADSHDPLLRHMQWSTILTREAEMIFRIEGGHETDYTPLWSTYETAIEPAHAAAWSRQPLNRILGTDVCLLLPGGMLCKVDTAGMAHGLEIRVPLLDRSLVEYVMQLPGRYKLDGRHRKRVLIDAHRDLLPPGVAERPRRGLEVPIGEFLRRPLRDLFRDVVDRKTVESFGWLDYDAVAALYETHCRRRDEFGDLLYALLVLCWWRQKHP